MSNVPSLFCPDPIISILQYYNSLTLGNIQNHNLERFLNENPFPLFTQKEINNIISNRNQGLEYSKIFTNIQFNFNFKTDFLSKMNPNFVINNSDFEATTKIILYSYISYMLELDKTQLINSENLKLLFVSLMFLTHSSHIEIIQDVFFHLFVIYLDTEYSDEEFAIVYSHLRTFLFTTTKSFPRTEKFMNRILFKLIPSQSTSFTPNAILILTLLSDLISKFHQTFTQSTAENILYMISNELLAFDQTALQTFSSVIPFVNDEIKSEYIEMISNTLNICINQSNYEIKIPNQHLPIIETEPTSPLFQFPKCSTNQSNDDSNQIKTNSNDVVLTDEIPTLPLYDSYLNLIDENISKIVISIVSSLKSQPDILTKLFTSIGKNIKTSENVLNAISLFVVFYYEIHHAIPSHSLPQTMIFLSPNAIFNQNVICDQSMIALNSLRHYSFELIFDESEITIASIIQNSYKSPYFFNELIIRLINYGSKLIKFIANSNLIINSIAKSFLNIQKAFYEGRSEFNSVRLTFLKFILVNIHNDIFQNAIFEDFTFISCFISFIFDQSLELKQFVFDNAYQFFIESTSVDSNFFLVFCSVFDSLKLENDNATALEIDLINLLCRILDERPELRSSLEIVNKSVFNTLQQMKKTKKCKDLFLLIINFFVKMGRNVSIDANYKEMIKNATIVLFDNNPPFIVFQSFIHLLTMNSYDSNQLLTQTSNNLDQKAFIEPNCKKLSSIQSNEYNQFNDLVSNAQNYLIKHEFVLPLLFETFQHTGFRAQLIEFLDNLLDNDENIYACNKTSFDKYLLEIYESDCKNNKDLKSLFTKIALTSTTVPVVLKFILLLSPKRLNSTELLDNMPKRSNSVELTENEIKDVTTLLKRSNSIQLSKNDTNFIHSTISTESSEHSKLIGRGFLPNASNLINIDDLVLPSNFPNLLEYLDELLFKTLENQCEAIFLDKSIKLSPVDIQFYENHRSFTFACWLYIDKLFPNYFPRLFTATDDENHLIDVFLSMNQIRIQIDPKRSNKSLAFNYKIPTNQWTLIALSFRYEEHLLNDEIIGIDLKPQYLSDIQVFTEPKHFNMIDAKHYSSSNSKNTSNFTDSNEASLSNDLSESKNSVFHDANDFAHLIDEFQSNDSLADSANNIDEYVLVDLIVNAKVVSSLKFNKRFMINTKSKFSFCGSLKNSLTTNFLSKIGPFAVFDLLSLSDFNQMLKEHQRFFGRCLSSNHKKYYLNQPYNQGPKDKISSFSALFVMKCKLELLTPLFRFLNLPYESGIEFPNFMNILFNIFEHSIQFGSIVENQLNKSNIFGIIQQILLENDFTILNYELYLKFYELLMNLQDDKLKISLLRSIIINLTLWKIALLEDQFNIYNHWLHSVYPNYINLINQFYSFSLLFNDIIYNLLIKSEQPNSFNSSEISIELMFQILNFFPFQLDDFVLLISYLSTTKSNVLIKLISEFIKSQIDKSTFVEMLKSEESMIVIEKAIQNGSSEAIKAMIEIIFILHKKKIYNEISLNDHIHLIINEISNIAIDKDFIKYLMNTTNSFELFSFECWIASTHPNNDFCYILNNIKPSSDFVCGENWSFWPIYFIVQNPTLSKINEKMMWFLANCAKYDRWADVYHMIEVISNLLIKPSAHLKKLFIKNTFDIIKSEHLDFSKIGNSYIRIVYNFMFYRDMRYDSIDNIYQNSPFYELRRSSSISFPDSNDIKRSQSLHFDKVDSNKTRQKPVLPPKPILKLNKGPHEMKYLFNNNELKLGPFIFGVRFDPLTLKWLDKDLADDLLTFLYSNEKKFFVHFKLLLVFFFLHDKTNKTIVDYLKQLKINDKSINQPLIDIICQRLRINGIEDHPFLSYQSGNGQITNDSSFFDCFPKELESEERIFQNYYQICKKYQKKILNLVEKYQNAKTQINFNTSLNNFEMMQYRFHRKNRSDWKRLYFSFTMPKTPWSSISSEKPIKISSKICKNYFPFAFQINNSINKNDNLNFYDRFLFHQNIKEHNCQIITIKSIDYCQIKVDNEILHIFYSNGKIKTFPLILIHKIWRTTVFLRPTAFELVFKSGESFIVNFMNTAKCLELYNQLLPFSKEISIEKQTIQWMNGKFSNFEYLMDLNSASGRSFNNLIQYPIFPWVIVNYKSNSLDLSDQAIYRDFSKPIGALSTEKLSRYFDVMNEKLKSKDKPIQKPEITKRKRNSVILKSPVLLEPKENNEDSIFLYPKAINTSLDVVSYLHSFEPFSHFYQEAIDQHLTVFNFSSISDLFDNLLDKSSPFLSELIPEFFSFFEILKHSQNLPKWASNSLDFVYTNRKALEADFVSLHLPKWIDLIWGYKQTGPRSRDNLNNYDPHLYSTSGLTSSNLKELVDQEKEKIVKGIMPKQLFRQPHPMKKVIIHNDSPNIFNIKNKFSDRLVFISIINPVDKNSSVFEIIMVDSQFTKINIKIKNNSDLEDSISKNSNENLNEQNPFNFHVDKNVFKIPIDNQITETTFYTFKDLVIINTNKKSYLLSHDKVTILDNQFYCFASDDKIMVGIGTDSLLYFYSYEIFTLINNTRHFYRQHPNCVAISSKFHICVIGTNDGFLSIYPIEKGSTVISIDIKSSKPKEILITPNLGFIITYAITRSNLGRFYVHSINGSLIKSSTLASEITAITTLESRKGLDYIVFAIKEGNIFICEAFSLKNTKHKMKLDPPITRLKYIKRSDLLVAVNADGIITCISLENIIL